MGNTTTEELRALLGKVTQGEWHLGKDYEAGLGNGFFVAGGRKIIADMRDDNQHQNAALIALAPTLAAEVVRLREAFTKPQYPHLDAACYGVNCYPDELDFILGEYYKALNS